MSAAQDLSPHAVVPCRRASDVVRAISMSRELALGRAVRSGGHCFAGRSSTQGILIDVGPMNGVALNDGIARVGAGAQLAEIYGALASAGVTIAGGCGSTVGIAGLTLGGGLGILGRSEGLTCDQLIGAQVVLADGRIVECDEHCEPDLFWALRGAGAGAFGVVTRLDLMTVPAPPATAVDLTWPPDRAAASIAAWQEWAPGAPDEVAVSLLLVSPGEIGAPAALHVFGAILASETEARDYVQPLMSRIGTPPSSARFRHGAYDDVKRYLTEHGPGDEPESATGTPERHAFSKSDFFGQSLGADAIAALAEHFCAERTPGQTRSLDFSPWGGAYNRVAADATAFPHRTERFLLKHEVAIDADAGVGERHAARDWLAESWRLVHGSASGGVYPNFPDLDLDDPARAYYGTNLARLEHLKRTYDPDNVFDAHPWTLSRRTKSAP